MRKQAHTSINELKKNVLNKDAHIVGLSKNVKEVVNRFMKKVFSKDRKVVDPFGLK